VTSYNAPTEIYSYIFHNKIVNSIGNYCKFEYILWYKGEQLPQTTLQLIHEISYRHPKVKFVKWAMISTKAVELMFCHR